jgi:hypothetical protein
MKTSLLKTAGALLLALATHCAVAVPITGTLDFAGGATLDSMNLAAATRVVSFQSVFVTPGGVTPGSVLDSTINPGDSVTMSAPWVFGSGLANLWSVGGFTFNLQTSAIVLQNANFLAVTGMGTIVGNGYDATQGTWYFTTQGSSDMPNFSFSATTVASANVPEGGATVLLLGVTLVGAAAASRLRRRRV